MIGWEVGRPTPRLRYRNAKHFGEPNHILAPARSPDFWSHMKDWILAFDKHLRRALNVLRIWRNVHRHRKAFTREDFCFEIRLVEHITRHANKGGPTRGGERNLEGMSDPFGNAVAFFH